MIIAERLRTSNRAEYILYMWQVEDLLRSYHLDFDELRSSYLSRFQLPEEQSRQTERWYACRYGRTPSQLASIKQVSLLP